MSEAFGNLVLAARLEEAIEVARAMPFDDMADALQRLAFESESLNCYGFAVALVDADKSAKHHYLAAEILALSPLNALNGAYHLAYYHARRAAALAPDDWSYLEFLLFFHRHPDQMMTQAEAESIAHELLRRNPGNPAALKALGS